MKEISLVSTIFNDRAGLECFFAAMSAQTRVPDEIVIVDAGSKDGTWELMQAEAKRADRPWVFHALQELGCNVARGRNMAIERASGGIIVSTDIGCDWDPEWVDELVAPLEADPGVELVIGSWAVRREELHGSWDLTEWALKGDQRLEATAESYSSSRSIAYRKGTWEALGRYPEDLTLAADDAVFHYLIEQAGVRRVGAPKIRCYWHRHASLGSFFKESNRYGLGDGEAGIRGRDVILIGGRLALESACLILGGLSLCPGMPLAPWSGLAFLGIAALSVLGKIAKMRGAIGRLREAGVGHPLVRLLAFTYGYKWHWLRGYAAGLRRGNTHCRETRRRLREMTPVIYKERLAKATSHESLPVPPLCLLYICEADTGGIAEYAIRQTRALAGAGAVVTVLCRPTFPTERLEGVEFRTDLPPQPVRNRFLPLRLLARMADARTVAAMAARTARRGGFQRVLFACYHEYFAPFWAPVLRGLAREGVEIGTIAHDPVRDFVVGPLWWHRWSVRQGYSFICHVFVHDDTPVDFGGPKPDGLTTHVLPIGPFDLASSRLGREAMRLRLGFTEADHVFLSFGQIRDGKNLDLFLRAMVDAPSGVKLMVVGAGGSSSQRPPEHYRQLADQLGVQGRCRWDLRHIPEEEVGDFFAAADCVLLTYSAKFRSASGVLNAAVASRKPVLASSGAGPLRGAVEAYQLGVLIPPDDTVAVSDGILRTLASTASPQWNRYLEENSWERNARCILDAFHPDSH